MDRGERGNDVRDGMRIVKRAPRRRPWAGMAVREGFTFIELVIVLMVLGVLSTMMLPRVPLARYRMDGAVRGVAAALVSAQRVAVKKQHDVVVSFDVDLGAFRVHEDADNDGVVDGGERMRLVEFADGVTYGRGGAPALSFGSDDICFTNTQDGRPAVTFQRNGSTTEAGGLYVTTVQATVESGHESHARAVEVDRATGRTSWYYYDSVNATWRKGF